jgi:glyoxylase-like metal-dependent hydrolase (beta-lactamase superfamily II)
MAEVIILIQGHLSSQAEDKSTCPTISLVRDGDIIMVVDPGVLPDQNLLLEKLKAEGLAPAEVNYVFLTHSHFDHYANTALFGRAKVLEFFGLWDKAVAEDWTEQFSKNIRIIKTPGHNSNSITALVKTERGIIAICGDVFWQENFPEDDPYASDQEKLAASRKLVTESADYIIPGHGDIYKVKK